jgi:hypothetical protein
LQQHSSGRHKARMSAPADGRARCACELHTARTCHPNPGRGRPCVLQTAGRMRGRAPRAPRSHCGRSTIRAEAVGCSGVGCALTVPGGTGLLHAGQGCARAAPRACQLFLRRCAPQADNNCLLSSVLPPPPTAGRSFVRGARGTCSPLSACPLGLWPCLLAGNQFTPSL